MAVRRSERIAELEANKKGYSLYVPKYSKSSEELMKAESQKLKEELKEIQKTLKTTKSQLAVEQGASEVLQVRVCMMNAMKNRVNRQNEEMKKILDTTTKTMEEQKEKIQEMLGRVENCENHEQKIRVVEQERENTMKYRKEYLEEVEKYSREEDEKNGGPLPWRLCEICAFPFGQEEKRVPRVLKCGHTVCTECGELLKCQISNSIRCPYDRQTKMLGDDGIQGLPKNFVILNL